MSGERYPAGTIEISGVDVPIFTDTDGHWVAVVNSKAVLGTSRADLETQLVKIGKAAAAAVDIPFVMHRTHSPMAARGRVTGLHGGNGNLLVTWAGGEKDQLTRHPVGRTVLDGDTSTEEWLRLLRAAEDAKQALWDYENAHKIDLWARVRQAIGEAIGEEPPRD